MPVLLLLLNPILLFIFLYLLYFYYPYSYILLPYILLYHIFKLWRPLSFTLKRDRPSASTSSALSIPHTSDQLQHKNYYALCQSFFGYPNGAMLFLTLFALHVLKKSDGPLAISLPLKFIPLTITALGSIYQITLMLSLPFLIPLTK